MDLSLWHRPPKKIALAVGASEFAQFLLLLRILDALGNDVQSKASGEIYDRPHDGCIFRFSPRVAVSQLIKPP